MNASRKSKIQIVNADCERWIVDQPDDCVDVVILDPPYKWQYVDNIILESMRVCRGPVFLMHPLRWDYETNPRPLIHVDDAVGERLGLQVPIESDFGPGKALISVFNAPNDYERECGSIWSLKNEGVHVNMPTESEHPGMKPRSLFSLLLFTLPVQWRVGTVLDPFMGSGNCGLSAEYYGMDYIGVEIDAKWCERAKEMLNA